MNEKEKEYKKWLTKEIDIQANKLCKPREIKDKQKREQTMKAVKCALAYALIQECLCR